MQPKSILIVDDDLGHLQLMQLALNHLGCPIHTARSAVLALQILNDETPAVILLDIAMPELSGEDLLYGIKNNPRFATTKILLVTAVPMRVSQEMRALVEGVLPKPFDLDKLERLVFRMSTEGQAM
ncbi:MAG: response regulator [Anaerolineae bacterium]|nr:response regulator [Anaerolineae bacterium]